METEDFKHQKKLIFQHSEVPRMSITTGTGLASKAKLKSYCIAKGLKSKIMHQFLCKARSKGNLNFIQEENCWKSIKRSKDLIGLYFALHV